MRTGGGRTERIHLTTLDADESFKPQNEGADLRVAANELHTGYCTSQCQVLHQMSWGLRRRDLTHKRLTVTN